MIIYLMTISCDFESIMTFFFIFGGGEGERSNGVEIGKLGLGGDFII